MIESRKQQSWDFLDTSCKLCLYQIDHLQLHPFTAIAALSARLVFMLLLLLPGPLHGVVQPEGPPKHLGSAVP